MLGLDPFTGSEFILLLVRIVLGVVMVYYGTNKINDLKSNANDFEDMGFKPGIFWGTIVAFVEFFGGVFIILGILPELFALLFGFQMLLGTFWKIKVGKPFTDWSYDIQLLVMALVVVCIGSGYLTWIPLFI